MSGHVSISKAADIIAARDGDLKNFLMGLRLTNGVEKGESRKERHERREWKNKGDNVIFRLVK